jgi:hypothetical protein
VHAFLCVLLLRCLRRERKHRAAQSSINTMGDSLQSYFANLLGCNNRDNDITVVSDNARSKGFDSNDGSLDWLIDWCSMDTTEPFCFSRWESVPEQNGSSKRDDALKRPPRRPSVSESPIDDEEFAAIYMPKEDDLDVADESLKRPIQLTFRETPDIQRSQ